MAGQQSLIYSFVARDTVILAHYTIFSGNFMSIASEYLQKLPASKKKFTYNCDGHTFNYLVGDGFTYCVVAVESIGKQIPITFLERIKEEFTKKYGGGKATTAVAHSLNKEFRPKLKEQMQYCVDHPEDITMLAKVKARVSEVEEVIKEKIIEKVFKREEKIEIVLEKTESLRSQQSLIYSFVARGTVILAHYTNFSGNFMSIASEYLQKLPASKNKFTYNCDGHTFNYLVGDGFTYCVVAVESIGKQIPITFLERIKEEFTKKYGGGKATTAVAHSLNKEFRPKLKEQMQYCVDHPKDITMLAKVKARVSEVEGVISKKIFEKVFKREEKLEILLYKTESLQSQAEEFGALAAMLRAKSRRN